MKYHSTRGCQTSYSASQAIEQGLCEDRGLFVPESFPTFTPEALKSMQEMDYATLAFEVLKPFLTDYSEAELKEALLVYDTNFSHPEKTPVVKLSDSLYVLELWHGPTLAFKDMALQLMPRLFVQARQKQKVNQKHLILVATSGDTGKAALEGFKNLSGVEVVVFYPVEGVSEVQKRQMVTSEGENLTVVGVEGNFDDCQNAVKNIFQDDAFKADLSDYKLSSANSINLGRLLPQIVYYFKAYLQLVNDNEVALGDKINFSVPTGNFGDILAGYYAKKMGLPIDKLICASNENRVLTDFFKTGVYDLDRPFVKTSSPSMDILVSSNLERYLYHLLDDKTELTKLYHDLETTGRFEVSQQLLAAMKQDVIAEYCTEADCYRTIAQNFKTNDYLMDPHSAVAMQVAQRESQGKTVVLSTASIYKFPTDVLKALGENIKESANSTDTLEQFSKVPQPSSVKALRTKQIHHFSVIKKNELKSFLSKLF
ncbi:MAG: threonine synthase [Lentisphaeria bacterium]|nr:threonine synthase [Lentisphaeria bacterium]